MEASGGKSLLAVKVASSIFVNKFKAAYLEFGETWFQFQFELSLVQFSPSLFSIQYHTIQCMVVFGLIMLCITRG